MVFNVHGGHSINCRGASGYLDEVDEDRKIKDKVIKLLREQGHTVYDCTFNGNTQASNLNGIVRLCNAHNVDLDVSIHFNASNGSGHGVEVLCYKNPKASTVEAANRICAKIAKLGFTNRGIKYRDDLYILNNTKAEAILIECCFCDNKQDSSIYDCDSMAQAIVEGILNKNINMQKNIKIRKKAKQKQIKIRSEPKLGQNVVGYIKDNNIYTLVQFSGSFGKLKGGKGWVTTSEKYVDRIK